MTIDNVIRWLEIQIDLTEKDLNYIDDPEIKEAQMRSLHVSKMSLKSLQCWKEYLEETKNANDNVEVGVIEKYLKMIEEEGKE